MSRTHPATPILGFAVPTDAESAIATVAPFLRMTPDERLREHAVLVRALAAFAGDRPLLRGDDLDPLSNHWKDPRLSGRRA